ncbi:putative bifunctional diguanylate cyclase/phosphodiesterase [Dyella ginsengisoli]|uniref:putative bifunctional diguanylate cyclase/phosphodiesterase n=1 Tax=Dyella ginsengisoli TaxID=363848 RepID=UPI00034CDF9F|nr:GGDEF domain-containing phosphodiesterase [Dyella ginsengisoli]
MLNRDALLSAFDAAIRARAGEDRVAAVVLRIEGLRERRLRFGYAAADAAVAQVIALIADALRPADRVFRIGEDLFALLLPGMRNAQHALLAATRLMQAFEQPVAGQGEPWRARPVMGIALYPDHGEGPESVLLRADMAMDEALRLGEQHAVHDGASDPVAVRYGELRDAIESNRLAVFLQPIFDLQAGGVVAAESLARWPAGGASGGISPADFVPFAEQSGLIGALTHWSINATLRHAAQLPPAAGMKFSINLSPRVFDQPGLVEKLTGALEIWGIAPERVVAEVTETALVNDLEQTVRVLRRLRDRGLGVAIDDFGTGYASIAYLRKFPATELKIDISLVRGLEADARGAALMRAIIDMAHHLDLVTVAEGIEDPATRTLLARMGCDFGQGHHLGEPMPAGDFISRFGA